MKITSLMFGLIFASLFIASFGLLISDMSDYYGGDFDNSTLDLYTRLNDTQAQAFAIQDSINESSTETGIVDILGGLVTKGVDSLKLTYNSLTTANAMVGAAVEDTGMPYIYKTAIVTVLFIFVVIGVIISVLVKTPL